MHVQADYLVLNPVHAAELVRVLLEVAASDGGEPLRSTLALGAWFGLAERTRESPELAALAQAVPEALMEALRNEGDSRAVERMLLLVMGDVPHVLQTPSLRDMFMQGAMFAEVGEPAVLHGATLQELKERMDAFGDDEGFRIKADGLMFE